MKILLLTPPSLRMMNPVSFEADMLPVKTWVPLGIAYLASSLRDSGFETELRDLHDWEWNEVESLIADSAPDLVGVSCFTFGRGNAMRVASMAKRAAPDATIVMGGPHATLFPEQMLRSRDVDIVVLGEGEITIVELAKCLAGNADFSEIKGIAYRKNDQFHVTPPRARLANLDAFPFPTYDAFDLSEYKSPEVSAEYNQLPGTHVITSRGCPFHCRFCSVNTLFGGRWAFRSPGNIADELEMLVQTQGVRHVYFSDDLFTLDRKRTIRICREILDRKIKFVWMAETRVDCVDAEMLSWMRKAGCYRVYYGVESGSPRILKSINKGFTAEQVRAAFQMTHQAGMEPCCFLMVGNPGETPETIAETIELIREIRPATVPIMGIATILPGTELYELSMRQGIISQDYWLSDEAPPLYTGEHEIDDLICLQLLLTKGICPDLYEQMRQMGLDDNFFRLRRMTKNWS